MNQDRKLKLIKTTAMIIVVVLLAYFIVFHKTKSTTPALQPPVVIVKKPILAEMAEYITETGNTVAYNSVNLVARVEGYLDAIKFTDGTFVKKGQELFVIEPQPYLDQLKEAQASVAAQKANLAYNKAEYARQQQMYKENATSLNSVQKWLAKQEESEADVAKAEANANSAGITYSYTHVLAPFDGRIGRHLIDVGNLVGNGKATDLATIEQIDPIYVYFNVNELDLIKIRTAARARGFKPSDINKIPVYVGMQNEAGFPHEGRLDFVNTGLNASTGTMEFRALFPNKNYTLVPGLFVHVRIAISKPSPRLTVPDTAVQSDQIGPYLLVVDKNNIVVTKRVEIGGLEQGMRAITKGLDAQDDVIVSGLQNATPGNPVTPQFSS
ncbi:efflux RND transporter periplasmic adaptor subunit [Legionella oakridgensis]|uniref:RND family efflux transporter, MFP subunit n=2 Tax=Legionella oakridgensis TaxID=29423 RepID=W0BF36_9GAMM|nr:efflux RND transporter periplasmic adaptor subunit [Legionella oakridgensis]AHE67049.1 RND family efflux transporter, MFP subunit [Legionella oakridgensis ATCC 33761 = DSM 21215]ETO93333.1 RND family efflux transporter, MFP subunit [Legionella oakridgensis RV-2-2007]KTD37198.1 RND multidrug efflux membrane fusion protein [Legionella oakridgensis]STY20142.1 RND multidrug efflux membrane fusion protein [Legionella longbeachae]